MSRNDNEHGEMKGIAEKHPFKVRETLQEMLVLLFVHKIPVSELARKYEVSKTTVKKYRRRHADPIEDLVWEEGRCSYCLILLTSPAAGEPREGVCGYCITNYKL